MGRFDDFSEDKLEADTTIKERRDAEHQRYSTLLILQAKQSLYLELHLWTTRQIWTYFSSRDENLFDIHMNMNIHQDHGIL
mmetsp:Transcript_29967/g.30305  ORF Transcript_29967/g.30305 Transcript_29967/m.30305 type:complete len:81 (-) Transcript_29967:693-935(-)